MDEKAYEKLYELFPCNITFQVGGGTSDWTKLTRQGDCGISVTWQLDDVNADNLTHTENPYIDSACIWDWKILYTHTPLFLNNKMTKLKHYPLQSTQNIPSNFTVWFTLEIYLRYIEEFSMSHQMILSIHSSWGTFYINCKYL